MKSAAASLVFLFVVSFVLDSKADTEKNDVYIVYMGSSASDKNYQSQLLSSLLKRKNALVRSYRHGFSGFAARLTEAEATSIAQNPGVLSVFPDPVFQLHTTRSWDFLRLQTHVIIDSNPTSDSGSDTIIGILDTGIWPESESFNDKGTGPIPSRWKGTCVTGHNFNSSNCNRKLIGARYYNEPEDDDEDEYNTPRDMIGHGTHVAATAAGAVVPQVSYYGLAEGAAKGGSPGSRIAIYRVCSQNGCQGSSILAGFDDAIGDGVDVISVSLGAPSIFMPDFKDDPIAIGAFHAVENGITVVCSAGNDGPTSGSVVNGAPWIVTVAASTIDRDFESDAVLGGNKVIKGEGINFANIEKSPVYPIIRGKSANKSDADEDGARKCQDGAMNENAIKGKIVICENDENDYSVSDKEGQVKLLGGVGLLVVDDKTKSVASNFKDFPMSVISSKDAAQLFSYINSTKNPVATILPTTAVSNYKPAPTIAYFSSRGPYRIAKNILKPDIAAPGVDILAAWLGNDHEAALKGKEPPQFNLLSGTSMACPHVSGLAALVKAQYPTWSPSAIKSAIMTTAIQANNMKSAITTETGNKATPYDYGAGQISTSGPLQPGLVYETTSNDYLNFLCFHGYNLSTIKMISKLVPHDFSCPTESNQDLISNINYPSVLVSNLKQSRNITRTVTNVAGDGDTTYSVVLEVPEGLEVKVFPKKLQFTKNSQRLSYHVLFSANTSSVSNMFGSITWTNGMFKVRSPFVVSS